jgi:hypothetical protein
MTQIMKPSDEILMAYADNELDAAARASVEAAMALDPELARRVARHQALRNSISHHYQSVLNEPVPDRLVSAVRGTAATEQPRKANVTNLNQVRAAKGQAHSATRRWSWPEWSSMAASLVLGVAVSYALLRPPGQVIANNNGRLIAQGALNDALAHQLAGDQAQESSVQIGVSFVAKSGNYCRAFTTLSTESMAGIACRDGNEWTVRLLAPGQGVSVATGSYRMAGTALPAAVTQAINEQIAGDPLDAADEVAARDSGWRK